MPAAIVGQWGVRTARALKQLIAAKGRSASAALPGPLWWITEVRTARGRNKARDRTWLMVRLKRDGRSLTYPGGTAEREVTLAMLGRRKRKPGITRAVAACNPIRIPKLLARPAT